MSKLRRTYERDYSKQREKGVLIGKVRIKMKMLFVITKRTKPL